MAGVSGVSPPLQDEERLSSIRLLTYHNIKGLLVIKPIVRWGRIIEDKLNTALFLFQTSDYKAPTYRYEIFTR